MGLQQTMPDALYVYLYVQALPRLRVGKVTDIYNDTCCAIFA